MTIAEINGKISSSGSNISDRLEDLLTSDVFGAFKYLDPKILFIPFFNKSININEDNFKCPGDIRKIEYKFWPRLTHCEPDLMMHLELEDGKRIKFLIEAKYYSGKSGKPLSEDELEIAEVPSDQLAKEFKDLYNYNENSQVFLFYITSHRSIPKKNLDESIYEIESLMGIDPRGQIFWNSWYNILPIIDSLDYIEERDKLIINDLKLLLEKKRFTFFNGFGLNKKPEIILSNFFYKAKVPPSFNFFKDIMPIPIIRGRLYKSSHKLRNYNWELITTSPINSFYIKSRI